MARIVQKQSEKSSKKIVIRSVAILLSLVTGGIMIAALGHNPFLVYAKMLEGSFGNAYRMTSVLNKAIPLTIIALGISVAFRMKFWNIGAEGQIIFGAFFASYFALYFGNLPKVILIPIMMLAGIIGGGLWALIPAFFRAKYNTNETLFTLMLNYIAFQWIYFLQAGPWRDPEMRGMNEVKKFTENAILPKIFGVHIGWIFAIILAIAVYIFFKKSKLGYEIKVVGESENTARYAGMNIRKIILSTGFISGAFCGLAGMMQASAISHTLSDGITGGMGFTAIIIAWLSGLSAPSIVITSFLFSLLTQGGSYIQTALGIQQTLANMLQGLILFFVLGSEFFIHYKIVFKKSE